MRVNELPPLRETIQIRTPSGRRYRWSEDAWRASDAVDSTSHGSTAPGGFSDLATRLPRKYQDAYHDLKAFSHIEVLDGAGSIVWEGYLEKAAQQSGDYVEVSPNAVGYQKVLEDVPSINWLGIDPDLNHWGDASPQYRVYVLTNGWRQTLGPSVETSDQGPPILSMTMNAGDTATYGTAWYAALPGTRIGRIVYDMTSLSTSDYACDIIGADTDVANNTINITPDLLTGTNSSASGDVELSSAKKYVFIRFNYGGVVAAGAARSVNFSKAIIIGDHGLPVTLGGAGYPGLRASDVISWLVRTYAPLLDVQPENVGQTDLPIPNSMAEGASLPTIIDDHNKYHLWNWAVWEGRQWYYQPQGESSVHRHWKARVGPSQLEDTGVDTRRIRNGVMVRFTDASGKQRTVGPPGSSADYQVQALMDADPLNPANQTGRKLYDLLDMRGVSEPEAAIQAGQRYLEQLKIADRSGQARISGYVQSHNGYWFPHTSIRADDTIEFTDASDPSPRRVNEVRHNRQDRTSDITLDAPREGLDAILDRMQLALVGLGL